MHAAMSDSPDYRLYVDAKFKAMSDEIHALRLDVRAGGQALRDLLEEIKRENHDHEKRVGDLEIANAYRSGQWKTLVAVGAAVGGLFAALFNLIVDKMRPH